MTHRAILRWPNGSDWGHAAIVPEDGGPPRFAGFVRMSDPHVRALLACKTPQCVDGDVREVHFTATERDLITA